MKHCKIGSLMVTDVVSVVPETPFKDVAKLLAVHDISGLPVLDPDDRVLGVISESDLMLRQTGDAPERRHHTGPSRLWHPGRGTGLAEAKAHATSAGDLMSRPAITVHADDTIAEAARTMARHRVERLPVVDEENRLVGIVTRRDLLQVFLRPDPDIRREVIQEVLVGTLWLAPDTVAVHVLDGVVTLEGQLERLSDIPVAVRLTQQVDGVVSVNEKLTYRYDDSHLRPAEQTLLGLADEDKRAAW
ncbi:CBS domain-containing protein [Streptomyces sp. XD-27]|uniref:CBS domain-containing protein n=1 Tax=Streptomyces sp. XD-27 TaxID=3062779 RepID=UPI0026F46E9F|nr:CBS domain-containing protein [Streptomyces sp. XD-27]WKX68998.1 CBS domain-containing protein [Streptomyces sp. XD-27]